MLRTRLSQAFSSIIFGGLGSGAWQIWGAKLPIEELLTSQEAGVGLAALSSFGFLVALGFEKYAQVKVLVTIEPAGDRETNSTHFRFGEMVPVAESAKTEYICCTVSCVLPPSERVRSWIRHQLLDVEPYIKIGNWPQHTLVISKPNPDANTYLHCMDQKCHIMVREVILSEGLEYAPTIAVSLGKQPSEVRRPLRGKLRFCDRTGYQESAANQREFPRIGNGKRRRLDRLIKVISAKQHEIIVKAEISVPKE